MDNYVDKVFVLDGAPDMGDLLVDFLTDRGCVVKLAADASAGIELLSKNHFDFLLISERIQGLAATEFVEKAVAINPDLYVILASQKEALSQNIRKFHGRFRRLPTPLILEDLHRIILANTNREDVS